MDTHTNNSFDIARHVAALMVFFAHHYALSGHNEPIFLGLHSYGPLGVFIFFSISGYLVTKSFFRSNDFLSFMEKRVRRIVPGLLVCSFVLIYFVTPFFMTKSLDAYLFSWNTFKSFLNGPMMLGLRPTALIFEDFIYPRAINASLWTIPIEFSCYLILGIGLLISKKWTTPFLILFFSSIAVLILREIETPVKYKFYQIPLSSSFKFFVIFFFGALLAITESSWVKIKYHLSLIFVLLIFVLNGKPEYSVLGHLSIAGITIILCTTLSDKLINGRFDISYGIYIYSFPVQQIIINKSGLSLYSGMFISLVIIILLASLSWILVEKRFIKRHNLA